MPSFRDLVIDCTSVLPQTRQYQPQEACHVRFPEDPELVAYAKTDSHFKLKYVRITVSSDSNEMLASVAVGATVRGAGAVVPVNGIDGFLTYLRLRRFTHFSEILFDELAFAIQSTRTRTGSPFAVADFTSKKLVLEDRTEESVLRVCFEIAETTGVYSKEDSVPIVHAADADRLADLCRNHVQNLCLAFLGTR